MAINDFPQNPNLAFPHSQTGLLQPSQKSIMADAAPVSAYKSAQDRLNRAISMVEEEIDYLAKRIEGVLGSTVTQTLSSAVDDVRGDSPLVTSISSYASRLEQLSSRVSSISHSVEL